MTVLSIQGSTPSNSYNNEATDLFMSAQNQDLRTRWIAAIRKAIKGEPLVEPLIVQRVEETFIMEDDSSACCSCFGDWGWGWE